MLVAAAPKASAADKETREHRVAVGENLYRISKNYGVSVQQIARLNGLSDVTAITVGQVLKIPGPAPKVSRPASSPVTARMPTAARTTSAPSRASVLSPTVATEQPSSGSLAWPVRGVLYARFGKKGNEPHDGIDLAAPAGTPVKTAAAGTVLFAGEQKGYGLIAIVDHGDGLVTLYAHNKDLRVQTGQKVREDQVVATVGESGQTSGPHLHFEVREHGRPIDPLTRLRSMSAERLARRATPGY